MLRSVTRGRLQSVLAAFDVERTPTHVVVHVPAGSAGWTRTGRYGGPRGRLLLPGGWDDGFAARPWTGNDVVMVHRYDEPWSTWRWLTSAGDWIPGGYINLERLWRVGESVYETEDLTLDIVVSGEGSLTFKDEDELDWAEEAGIYDRAEAAYIRSIGQTAHRHFARGGWPLTVDWDGWRRTHGQGLPSLPAGWESLPLLME